MEYINSVNITQNPLGGAPVGKLLRQFAVPSIVAMLVGALYNIVDQIFIGQSIGEEYHISHRYILTLNTMWVFFIPS